MQTLDIFNESRKSKPYSISATDKIKLNRLMLMAINKILKMQALEAEMEKNEVSVKMDRGVYCVFEGYRFINLFLNKYLPDPDRNSEMLDDPSFLSSEDEYEKEKIPQDQTKLVRDQRTEYRLSTQKTKQMKRNFYNRKDSLNYYQKFRQDYL